MTIKPIKSEEDYKAALVEINRLFDAHEGTEDFDRLDILATLVESYEAKHCPIAPPSPLAVIEYEMDEPGTRADVAARRGHSLEFYHDPSTGPGEFVSCEPGTGCIRINAAYPQHTQARVIVHELAHAELNAAVEPVCWPPAYRMGYDDEPGDVRHRICCRVEKICFRRT